MSTQVENSISRAIGEFDDDLHASAETFREMERGYLALQFMLQTSENDPQARIGIPFLVDAIDDRADAMNAYAETHGFAIGGEFGNDMAGTLVPYNPDNHELIGYTKNTPLGRNKMVYVITSSIGWDLGVATYAPLLKAEVTRNFD